MENAAMAAIAVAVVGAGFLVARWGAQSDDAAIGVGDSGGGGAVVPPPADSPSPAPGRRHVRWAAPAEYAPAIQRAEEQHGLPPRLLERLLWQESRYRPDVIHGRTRSPVGAIGIAQFMPATAREWNVDPRDPFQSIDGAARYLAWLKRKLGTWRLALAAYNWGIGNVQRRGLGAAPRETQNYMADIIGDVQSATGVAIK